MESGSRIGSARRFFRCMMTKPKLPIAGEEEKQAYSNGLRELVRVSGDSMRPELNDGDVVMIDVSAENFEVGDIVYAKHPFKSSVRMIKRIAAKTGESFILHGDNPAESTDSRTLGAFSKTDILGKATSIAKPAK